MSFWIRLSSQSVQLPITSFTSDYSCIVSPPAKRAGAGFSVSGVHSTLLPISCHHSNHIMDDYFFEELLYAHGQGLEVGEHSQFFSKGILIVKVSTTK